MSESDKRKILIVDDDEGILKVLSSALTNAGYIVDTANNARDAINKSHSRFYNLALIDIRLPDMEGTTLLTAMKENTPEMAKIILTGYPALENAIEAVNKGADGYLVKPIRIDELLRAVERELEKQRKLEDYGEEKLAIFLKTYKEVAGEELFNT
jgi:two-component system response regulator GlrR